MGIHIMSQMFASGWSTPVNTTSYAKGFSAEDFVQVSGSNWGASAEQDFSNASNNPESLSASGAVQSSLYKTELCRSFEETGACRYGSKCQFAHGKDELRPVARHPKYKTEVCKTFYTVGTCPYGKRCRFIHSYVKPGENPAPPMEAPVQAPVVKAQEFVQVNGSSGWANAMNGTSMNKAAYFPPENSGWSNSWTPVQQIPFSKPTPAVTNFSQQEGRGRLSVFQSITQA